MKNILSQEDKIELGTLTRFLKSMGLREGSVEFDIEGSIESSDINVEEWTNFSNSYNIEIPSFIKPTLKKVIDYIVDADLVESPDYDDINYEKISIEVDAVSRTISVSYYCVYTTESEPEGITYSFEEDENDEELKELFENLEEIKSSNPKVNNLELRYYGSGDSGYLEDYFDNTQIQVPSGVEDWCYRKLESNFGGWEINEGSSGFFYFNLKDKVAELVHTSNIEESESNTLYEEKF